MKNRVLLVFLAIVLVVSLTAFAACAKEEEAPPTTPTTPTTPTEPEPEPEPTWEWPEVLALVGTSPSGSQYGSLIGWSTPLAEDTGMKVRIACEDSPTLQHQWLKEGLFFTTQQVLVEQMFAKGTYATRNGGPFLVGIFYPISKMSLGYAVRGDSGIKTPKDIKPGMRMIYMTMVPKLKEWTEALLDWAGLTPDDVEWIPAGSIAAPTRLLMDGKGDVAISQPGGTQWLEAEASPHGLGWIELNPKEDPEAAARLNTYVGEWSYGPTTGGVLPSAEGVWMFQRISVYVNLWDEDPELVYQVVKWLDENYDKYKDSHPWCAQMTIDNLMSAAETHWAPLHNGTVKYIQEKGLWTAKHEARQQLNIDNINKWVEAYQTAIDMANEKSIKVDPENEEWMELWENYKDQLNLPILKFFPGID